MDCASAMEVKMVMTAEISSRYFIKVNGRSTDHNDKLSKRAGRSNNSPQDRPTDPK
jgi:hypothetical protein